ncbi:MAG: hypothetical protein AAFQ06_10755 [Pseudomonadota bacterium]
MSARPRIAIAFFGITRALDRTLPSIEANIYVPAHAVGDVRVFAHLYDQSRIDNPRSGEKATLDPGEYKRLGADWVEREPPGGVAEAAGLETFKSYGDPWKDGFRSLRNLALQLHSLNRVTAAVLEEGYDMCLFCRPDLRYRDSFARPLRRMLAAPPPVVFAPHWQAWFGANDRFALVSGREAILAAARFVVNAKG